MFGKSVLMDVRVCMLLSLISFVSIQADITFNGIPLEHLTQIFSPSNYVPTSKDEIQPFATGLAAGLATTVGAHYAMQPTTKLFPTKKDPFCVFIQEGETIIDLTLRDHLYKDNASVTDHIGRLNPLSIQGQEELFKSIGAHTFGNFIAESIVIYRHNPETREERKAPFEGAEYKAIGGSLGLIGRQLISPYRNKDESRLVNAYNKGLWLSKLANLAFYIDAKSFSNRNNQ